MSRGLFHAVAALVVLPYAALAGAFLLIGEMADARGLMAVFDVLLSHADRMLRWGIYVAPLALCALVVVGFVPRLRRAGLIVLALLSGGSLLTICVLGATRIGVGEVAFLLPCALVLIASVVMLIRKRGVGSSAGSR
jgi:hypothetical protein